MALRHVGQNRSQVRGTERKRHRHSQPAAKFTVGQDQVTRSVDLGAGSFRVIPEYDPVFRQSCAARRSREQLYAESGLEPGEMPADDRLRDAETARCRRYAAGISDFHERAKFFDVHFNVPVSATQRLRSTVYRNAVGDDRVRRVAAGTSLPQFIATNGDRGCIHDLS